MDIEVFADQSENYGKINRYVLSGDLVAGRITTTVAITGDTAIAKSYYHLDHLNSTKMITDEEGAVEVSYVYRAFGEQLKRLDASGEETGDLAKYSYGGKELDDGTNLYYFNARYYDATIGRFINVDPVQDSSNWYIYCSNNPLSFVDPTGLGETTAKKPVARYTYKFDKTNSRLLRDVAHKMTSEALVNNVTFLGAFSEALGFSDDTACTLSGYASDFLEGAGVKSFETKALKIMSNFGVAFAMLSLVIDYNESQAKQLIRAANDFLYDVCNRLEYDNKNILKVEISQEYWVYDFDGLWESEGVQNISNAFVGKATITAYFDNGNTKVTQISSYAGYLVPTMAALKLPRVEEWHQ